MTATVLTRPNGKPYRPRKIVAYAVSDDDECFSGVVVFGTHDPDYAKPLADQYVQWQLDDGYEAANPERVWWRDGFEYGQRRWMDDPEHGRAGVAFTAQERSQP